MLSMEIEYYQEIWNILKKKNKDISKLILLILVFFVFICRASRICNPSLLILCAIIVVFSTRIFQNLDLWMEWVLRCKAMEIESLRCIVSCLERVVVVRPTYVLFSLETVSQGTFEHIYDICPIKKFSGGGRVIGNNSVGGFKFVVVNDKSYFFW